jgi:hypothetical protein
MPPVANVRTTLNKHDPISIRVEQIDHDASPRLATGPAREFRTSSQQTLEFVVKTLNFDRYSGLFGPKPSAVQMTVGPKDQPMSIAIKGSRVGVF